MIRTIISILGLIAICFLIWFGGPMLAINDAKPFASPTVRLITILIIVILWGLNALRKMIKANKITKELLAGFSRNKNKQEEVLLPDDGSSAEVATLHKNFQEAVQILNKTKLGGAHGEHKLYELPWYIIIGPPGAGKTTALINSGLRFPLANRFGQQALRGVGGTRDCDWWFTDEAVLIDTAGRYTTQDSDASVDSAGWGGFLELLKKHRQRRPINGVLVAISLPELITQNEAERQAHANAIKHRIQELNTKLGISFPIYVLFTKLDLVAGFVEFFDDLGREERDQVWGFTQAFEGSVNYEANLQQFSQEFDQLIGRLKARAIPRLHQERDQQRRSLIHGFPHQLSSLKNVADQFLQEVFRPNRFEDAFLLRGVYCTSGTQEGTPIDRVMGALAATFGLDRQLSPSFSGQGRSYFLTRLFRDVIFQEAGIAGSDKRIEKQRTWFQYGVYTTAIVATLSVTLIWSGSYAKNTDHIDSMKKNLADYQKQTKELDKNSDVFETLPSLQSLQNVVNQYQDESLAWLTGLALSKQGSIEPVANDAYKRVVKTDFLPRLAQRLEVQMDSDHDDMEFLSNTLKSYLMLGEPQHRDPEFIKLWLGLDWENQFPKQEDKQLQLKHHLHVLLDNEFEPYPLNTKVVASTRRILTRVPIERRVYARIKQEAMTETALTYHLDEVLGDEGQKTFRSLSNKGLRQRVSALYTISGFKDLFLAETPRIIQESTEENWVLGTSQKDAVNISQKDLNRKVEKFYVSDYIDNWQDLMADLEIVRFTSIRHGVDVVETLAGATSPLRGFLESVDKHTALDRKSDAADAALAVVAKKARRLAKAANAAKKSGIGSSKETPGQKIHKTFAPVGKLVTPATENSPVEIDNLLSLLAELHTYLDELASDPTGSAAFEAAKQRMASGSKDPIGKLRSKATRLPQPVKRWMLTTANESWGVVLANAHNYINTAWRSEVLPEYDRRLKDRYPLLKSTDKEITLADFSRFFGPDGTIESFYNNYLAEFFKKNQRGAITEKKFEGHTLGLNDKAIKALQRALIIKQIYFTSNEPQPLVPFKLKPVYLDAAIIKFALEIDGQRLAYRHGPMRSSNVQWPGPDGAGRARLIFEASSGSRITRTKEGPWGLFRMLDQADMRPAPAGDKMKITFKMDGHTARYELQANSVENPFRLKSLERFRAPETL